MNPFQPSDHQLYFVYGSNMNPAQIAARCCKPEVVAIARLADYRLAFFGHSRVWDSGEAAVIHYAGEEVWGVVYKLSLSDADALDAWQDVRIDGTGTYFLCPVDVVAAEGVRYRALIYKRDICGEPQRPSEAYLDHIVAGAVAHGLPADYIERLKRIESQKASYPVPRKEPSDRAFLFNRACTGCG